MLYYISYIYILCKWIIFFLYRKRLRNRAEVPVVVQQKRIWLASMRMQVQTLAFLSGLPILCCHELWCRLQMWLRSSAFLLLWYKPAATAPIWPLAWELPYAIGAALKRPKKKKVLPNTSKIVSLIPKRKSRNNLLNDMCTCPTLNKFIQNGWKVFMTQLLPLPETSLCFEKHSNSNRDNLAFDVLEENRRVPPMY